MDGWEGLILSDPVIRHTEAGSAGLARLDRSPRTKVTVKTEQVSIWIGDNELAIAALGF